MNTVTEILNAIEADAERACVQELRRLCTRVMQMRAALGPDDRDHADALVLKLRHLAADQVALLTDGTTQKQRFEPVALAA